MKKLSFKVPAGLRKAGYSIRKHSPEILMVAGMVGTAAGTVMACKATIKAQDIIFDLHDEIDVNCPEKAAKKAKMYAYCDVAKAYAPSVTVMLLSFGMIFAGNAVQRKRYAELAAAYITLDKAYKSYRQAVREKFGVDVDRELAYGAKKESIDTVDENGKKKKEKVTVVDPDTMYSPYARFFDSASKYWSKDPQENLNFLVQRQHYWTEYLKRNGHVYFNEVLRSLDIPETSWTNAGWVYDKSNPDSDCEIDFRIFDCHRPRVRDFCNGYENVIIIDPNVDGDISEHLAKIEMKAMEFEKLPLNYKSTVSGRLIPIGGEEDVEG